MFLLPILFTVIAGLTLKSDRLDICSAAQAMWQNTIITPPGIAGDVLQTEPLKRSNALLQGLLF